MSDQPDSKLKASVQGAKDKVRRFKDRSLGEQNTKATLIDPVLEALGWDIRDPDEVHREFKPHSQDKPVDYALSILRKPRLFVEAKGLGETLSDRRWIGQVLGYAVVAGVEWCVLTDGDEYRFYNATAALDAEDRLFCKVRLSEDDETEILQTLTLISRRNLEENLLDVLWNAHFVDRRVKQALSDLLVLPDKGLVNLLRRREPRLAPKEIIDSIRRLDIRVESPSPMIAPTTPHRRAEPAKAAVGRKAKRRARDQKPKKDFGVTLTDIIGAGLLSTPLKLFRKYKGRILEAILHPDGSVECQGQRFRTCSTAAEYARSIVTGRKMNTNGWDFWQFVDGTGRKLTLFDARELYLARQARP